MGNPELELPRRAASCASRLEAWCSLLSAIGARQVAEIGVYRGEFSRGVLQACPSIERYVMVDPWRHLPEWNKPANTDDARFEQIRSEAMQATEAFSHKRDVLQGTTTEVLSAIPDGSLDAVYIDGDHTLRGITIDLVQACRKVRDGGWIGGDDFSPTIWQHAPGFEPTFVFPFAVHFAEAMDMPIFALPFNQFLIRKAGGFAFEDLVGRYPDRSIGSQVARPASAGP